MITMRDPRSGRAAKDPGVNLANLSPDLRARLRRATACAHERLHVHPGFAAAAAGNISLSDYRLLLSRLFGFHKAFEAVLCERVDEDFRERARSHLIAADLQNLGLDRRAISRIALCDALQAPTSKAEGLGALYVLEGSTLGGVQIARALQPIVPGSDGRGRRFFLGYGERHGAMWRAFVERLERLAADPDDAAAAESAAVKTFEAFERWMSGWKAPRSSPSGTCFDLSPRAARPPR